MLNENNPQSSTKSTQQSRQVSLALSPHGKLYLDYANDQEVLPAAVAQKLEELFHAGYKRGLLLLGLANFSEALPVSFVFWQRFAQRFITQLCKHAQTDSFKREDFVLSVVEMQNIREQIPFMKGGEYLTDELLAILWNDLFDAFAEEVKQFEGISEFLQVHNPSWKLVGRIYFHLAENKNNVDHPFAFLATYTTSLTTGQQPKHLPLGRALEEYADEKNRAGLLSLLTPIHSATTQSSFLKQLVGSQDIYRALSWSAPDAYQFLKDVQLFEAAGIIVRIPNWWNSTKPMRPQVRITIGEQKSSALGLDGLIDFDVSLSLSNGDELSDDEWQEILNAKDTLIKVKGQWIEVNPEQLSEILNRWKYLQKNVNEKGLSLKDGLRLLAGTESGAMSFQNDDSSTQWSSVQAGSWLKKIIQELRSPAVNDEIQSVLKKDLNATLRPYQEIGIQWLWFLYSLQLGGCLADDMGLGKTIQVISLLLLIKSTNKKQPNLLIVPASLLGNWQAELSRFAPSLKVQFVHSSFESDSNRKFDDDRDLFITSYGYVNRLEWLAKMSWNTVILDEAQAIKNPSTQQARAVKQLTSSVRFVLTGTPLENQVTDLWSLFDFFAPGLLGSVKDFGGYAKKMNDDRDGNKKLDFFRALRSLTSPYILRRLKTDKRIISDLPDKTEMNAYCSLTKQQIVLYQQAVEELKALLETSEGIERKGLIFSYLMRFKQICNHPSQWLGYGGYVPEESGKFLRIKELCQDIAARQEKVLIFTQFQEIIPALHEYISSIFKQDGLILHGGVSVKKRADLVKAFQDEQGPPFFILSLKAGGVGLNLTQASHVIHFDRWWNPATENQATDRAFRIGQKKNVMVYKCICPGTIEEKIDELISSKKELSAEILETGKEVMLTQLSNEQVMNIVSLDIHRVYQSDSKGEE